MDSLRSALTDPTACGPLLVGFSGGLDSSVLLHALHTLSAQQPRPLRAIHVHHGLHPDAERWTEHCLQFCAERGIALVVARVQVDRDAGLGLEGAARDARYAAFAEHLADGEALTLAHHRDDQAETVLLRLLRGSGSDGLAAMSMRRAFAGGVLWRPLLQLARDELLAYAQAQQLQWIEDPSNDEHGLDRNFLRHRIMPLLRERWPHAGRVLARSAGLLAEDAELLQEQARLRLAAVQGLDPATLRTDALLRLSPAWRARVLRQWVAELGLAPLPGDAPARISAEVLRARADAQPQYRWRGALMQRWRDLLHVGVQRTPLPSDWSAHWDGREPLRLPTGDRLVLETDSALAFDSILRVHGRQGGERLRLPGRSHHHTLQHALQQYGVPPWERARLPLLSADDGELLAAGDLLISARLHDWLQEHHARLTWEVLP